MSTTDPQESIAQMGRAACAASRQMAAASTASRNQALLVFARLLREPTAALQAANAQNLQGAQTAGLVKPVIDGPGLTHQVVVTGA